MSASLHTSPTCLAQVLQQSQPSMRRLTPGAHVGVTAGHSQGHLQYCVRLWASGAALATDGRAAAGGAAVGFWEKAWKEESRTKVLVREDAGSHTDVILQSVETLELVHYYAERLQGRCQEEQSSVTMLVTSFSEKGSSLQKTRWTERFTKVSENDLLAEIRLVISSPQIPSNL